MEYKKCYNSRICNGKDVYNDLCIYCILNFDHKFNFHTDKKCNGCSEFTETVELYCRSHYMCYKCIKIPLKYNILSIPVNKELIINSYQNASSEIVNTQTLENSLVAKYNSVIKTLNHDNLMPYYCIFCYI